MQSNWMSWGGCIVFVYVQTTDRLQTIVGSFSERYWIFLRIWLTGLTPKILYLKLHSDWGFCKAQKILLRIDPKDVPICYYFALLFHEQKEQKKLIKYSPVIGYLLGNTLGSVESRMSFKNPLANL